MKDKVEGSSRLLNVGTVARLLGVSARQVYRLSDGGRMPQPIKLGGSVRWDRVQIEEWIGKGCPLDMLTSIPLSLDCNHKTQKMESLLSYRLGQTLWTTCGCGWSRCETKHFVMLSLFDPVTDWRPKRLYFTSQGSL